jgi:integrase
MQQLLNAAAGTIQLYLALGAFSGLRHAELMRLDWEEIKSAQKHIEVTAGKAKTAQRRIVPIQQNLRAWIMPHVQQTGFVFCGDPSRFLNRVTAVARDLKITWPQNGLRHSYASYRLAKCKSAAEVALEMGNSPAMVFRHYRELVTPLDAKKWWGLVPKSDQNVIPMREGKRLSATGVAPNLAGISAI